MVISAKEKNKREEREGGLGGRISVSASVNHHHTDDSNSKSQVLVLF